MSLKQIKKSMEAIKKIINEIDDAGLREVEELTGEPVAEQLQSIVDGYVVEALEEKYDPQMKLGQQRE